jgi:hypothetical protein
MQPAQDNAANVISSQQHFQSGEQLQLRGGEMEDDDAICATCGWRKCWGGGCEIMWEVIAQQAPPQCDSIRYDTIS